MTSEYTAGSDARIAAGDFNEDRCVPHSTDTEATTCAPGIERDWYKRITDGAVSPNFDFLDAVWQAECGGGCSNLNEQYKDGNTTRNRRIDFIFIKKAIVVRASHDLSCGAGTGGNCNSEANDDYYSDHRLVWATFKG